MKKLLAKYKEDINNNFAENIKSALAIKDYLEHSPVAYHGRCVHTLHIPKVFDEKVIEYFREIVKTTYGIFTKVINEYLTNKEYRKLFPFSPELQALIDAPRGYECVLPIARFDIFFNEDDWSFKFCEINTDGTSAMLEDYILNKSLGENIAHQKIAKECQLQTFELFDSWVEGFMDIYNTFDKKVEKPYIAIVDFLENASITEFEEFKKRFEAAGYETEICEISEMKYDNGKLYSPTGHLVDAVYRRAVTSDIMARQVDAAAFIQAVKAGNTCIIGAFCTQIIHNKTLFKVLTDEITQKQILTDEEIEFVAEHIPATNYLDTKYCCLENVKEMKDKLIIKPLDSYGSKGVYAGIDYSQEKWDGLVEDSIRNGDYLYQEYCPPYRTDNIYLVEEKPQWKRYTNMSGLFVYNGKLAGVYSRLSDGGIISSQYNEKAVATMYVDKSVK